MVHTTRSPRTTSWTTGPSFWLGHIVDRLDSPLVTFSRSQTKTESRKGGGSTRRAAAVAHQVPPRPARPGPAPRRVLPAHWPARPRARSRTRPAARCGRRRRRRRRINATRWRGMWPGAAACRPSRYPPARSTSARTAPRAGGATRPVRSAGACGAAGAARVRALDGFPGGCAWQWGGVQQAQQVVPAGGVPGQLADHRGQ